MSCGPTLQLLAGTTGGAEVSRVSTVHTASPTNSQEPLATFSAFAELCQERRLQAPCPTAMALQPPPAGAEALWLLGTGAQLVSALSSQSPGSGDPQRAKGNAQS